MGLTKPIEQICNLLIEQIKIVSKRYYTRKDRNEEQDDKRTGSSRNGKYDADSMW